MGLAHRALLWPLAAGVGIMLTTSAPMFFAIAEVAVADVAEVALVALCVNLYLVAAIIACVLGQAKAIETLRSERRADEEAAAGQRSAAEPDAWDTRTLRGPGNNPYATDRILDLAAAASHTKPAAADTLPSEPLGEAKPPGLGTPTPPPRCARSDPFTTRYPSTYGSST